MTDICKGNAIYLDIPSPESKHLFFVMTPQNGNPPTVVIVNISTIRGLPFEDLTVILRPGDHPLINHDSYIAFGYARKIQVAVLEERIKQNRAEIKDNLSVDVYEKILNGMIQSPNTPRNLKNICKPLI